MKKYLQKITPLFSAAGLFSASSTQAALPTVTDVAVGTGGYLGMIQDLFGKAYDTGALLIGAAVFLVVVLAVIIAFWQYHQGKKELSDVGVVAAAGGVVMTLVFVLLNNGATVI
ncbi:DUF2976 domain-containing protein [Vibrio mediterranei]|uniref:DUF2976 domain-containing protein n=1 Tax=Vibrio mediterranei TaxID=689 RepID=UPI004067A8A6